MKFNSLTFLGLAASAVAAPVSDDLMPDSSAPAGCSTSYDGTFEVSIYKLAAKRSLDKRSCDGTGVLVLTLEDGILKDSSNRTGYIASNYQFQFDEPPQNNAIYTAGWSTCSNGSLALGSDTTFYQCLSGNFYNLYNENWASQCEPVEIIAYSCSTGTSSGGEVTQIPDGQINGSGVTDVPAVTQISDGQIQVPSSPAVITQISDGQVQAPTNVVTQITDGQVQAPTATAPAASPPAVVTQITDGQIQAPTGTPPAVVTQITDGQVQAPTGTPPAVVTQITDGQVQAPTGTPPAVVTQITDGQVQAPPATVVYSPTTVATPSNIVTQIGDGQVQAPTGSNGTVTTSSTGTVPTGSGHKIVPGTMAGLALAVAGAFYYF